MAIVSHTHRFVIGVDTHAREHVLAVVAATGEVLGTAGFPTTRAGLARAVAWGARRTGGGTDDVLWSVEGAGSYGNQLVAALEAAGHQVVEAPTTSTPATRRAGKSDTIDATRTAQATLATDTRALRAPRADGARADAQVLLTARQSMTAERTRALNALTALLRACDLGVDARRPLTRAQVRHIAAWPDHDQHVARHEARRLATRATDLDTDLAQNKDQLENLVRASPAATLLEEKGIGPVCAATTWTAWSHLGRIRSEAAFAALAGTNPVPASSGNTTRHRLNRTGDRRLNHALHTIVLTRMRCHQPTRDYTARRTTEGLTKREIVRCLKRHLARHLYRTLNHAAHTHEPA
jgi:transposase